MGKLIPASELLQAVEFPMKGIDVAHAHDQQPQGTTPVGQNVRGFEVLTLRDRGGSRPGLAKYIGAQVLGFQSKIQHLALVADPAAEPVGSDPGNDDAAGTDPTRNLRGGGLFGHAPTDIDPLTGLTYGEEGLGSPGGYQPVRHRHRAGGGTIPGFVIIVGNPATGRPASISLSLNGSGLGTVLLPETDDASNGQCFVSDVGITLDVITDPLVTGGAFTVSTASGIAPGSNTLDVVANDIGHAGNDATLRVYLATRSAGIWSLGANPISNTPIADGTFPFTA